MKQLKDTKMFDDLKKINADFNGQTQQAPVNEKSDDDDDEIEDEDS